MTDEEQRQEEINHLCRFVVAGLLMAFGQYGRDGAVRHVSDLWRETSAEWRAGMKDKEQA